VIFVTIGSSEKGLDFTRLVEAMDRVAGRLGVDVLIQRGPVDYEPKHARHVRYVRFDEALRHFREADLVVGHCGAGTLINALHFGKPLIVVPRRAGAGELDTDDHQIQLAAVAEGMEGVRVVHDVGDLEAAVRAFLASPGLRSKPSEERQPLVAAVREFLAAPAA
jgi:UDP-N-acetylglucosamine transferase subunit ALG13